MNKKDINDDRDAGNIKDAKVNEVESDGMTNGPLEGSVRD